MMMSKKAPAYKENLSHERESFGCLLRQARLDAGLTLQQAAEKTGVKLSTLDHWERGISIPNEQKLDALLKDYQHVFFEKIHDNFWIANERQRKADEHDNISELNVLRATIAGEILSMSILTMGDADAEDQKVVEAEGTMPNGDLFQIIRDEKTDEYEYVIFLENKAISKPIGKQLAKELIEAANKPLDPEWTKSEKSVWMDSRAAFARWERKSGN